MGWAGMELVRPRLSQCEGFPGLLEGATAGFSSIASWYLWHLTIIGSRTHLSSCSFLVGTLPGLWKTPSTVQMAQSPGYSQWPPNHKQTHTKPEVLPEKMSSVTFSTQVAYGDIPDSTGSPRLLPFSQVTDSSLWVGVWRWVFSSLFPPH